MRIAIAIACLCASPVSAQELSLGTYHRAEEMPWNRDLSANESGTDLQLAIRIGDTWQPQAFTHIALHDGASLIGLGIGRKIGTRFYLRPAISLAIHSGPSERWESRRTDYGSRILLVPELAIGYRISEHLLLEASWFHASHAEIFSDQNPGLDAFGVRIVRRLK